ncbi:hypothetical protein Tco_1579580 [Tanacetum coccineum]
MSMDEKQKGRPKIENKIKVTAEDRKRERNRLVVERAFREAQERSFAKARERIERVAVERANAEVRQRVMVNAQQKTTTASSD